MPLYTVKCTHCGATDTIFRSVANRDADLPTCHEDDEPMVRIVDAPAVQADIAGYQSMATGEWISSRSQHREHLNRHSLVEVGNESIAPKQMTVPKQEDRKRLIAELVHSKR